MKHAESTYNKLKQGSLNPDSFGHEEHLHLAWYYVNRWGLQEASQRFSSDLQEFVKSVGAENKYHHTVTIALLRLINSHIVSLSNPQDWQAFKADSQPLFKDAKALLARFYSPESLSSKTARKQWCKPDRQNLPD